MRRMYFIFMYLLLLSDKLIKCALRQDNKGDMILQGRSCWMTLQAKKLCESMDEIDNRYRDTRSEMRYKDFVITDEILAMYMVLNRGIAARERFNVQYKGQTMLAGIHLGGQSMLRLDHSVLFFSRIKLRNDTRFFLDSVENDFSGMVYRVDFSMKTLRLLGGYERTFTDTDPSLLIYEPTFGEVEFLLRSVKYNVKCPYRLVNNRIIIDSVRSTLSVESVSMTFTKNAVNKQEDKDKNIPLDVLGNFLDRLKVDLDKWIRDFLNDVFISSPYKSEEQVAEFEKYDNEKSEELSDWMDNAIQFMNKRIHSEGVNNIRLPKFTIQSVPDSQKIKLYNGMLRGLGTMHRRSIPTSFIDDDELRKVDSLIGFSDLKVVYKYTVRLSTGAPPLYGEITLSANELTGHLAVDMAADPEALALDIDFLDHMKAESLTVEGAASSRITNFKHILGYHIVSIMTSTLYYGVKLVKSLPNCAPFIPNDVQRKPENVVPLPWNSDTSYLGKKRVYVSVESWSDSSEKNDCVRWIDFLERCADDPKRWFHKARDHGNGKNACITAPPNSVPAKGPHAVSTILPSVAPTITFTYNPASGMNDWHPSVAPTITPKYNPASGMNDWQPSLAPTIKPKYDPASGMNDWHPNLAPTFTPKYNPASGLNDWQPSLAPTIKPKYDPASGMNAWQPSLAPTIKPKYDPASGMNAWQPSLAPTIIFTYNPASGMKDWYPSVAPTITPKYNPASSMNDFQPSVAPTITPKYNPASGMNDWHLPTFTPKYNPARVSKKKRKDVHYDSRT